MGLQYVGNAVSDNVHFSYKRNCSAHDCLVLPVTNTITKSQ